MNLQIHEPKDRSFLIQLSDIQTEFGNVIPWLKPLQELAYITDPEVFEELFHETLHLTSNESVHPYMLCSDDRKKEYIGGLLHFTKSPEHFQDPTLNIIQEQLTTAGYSYLTCLQIRSVMQGHHYGTELFSKALETITKQHPTCWGVVAHENLLPWYEYFGGEILNTIHDTKDHLAIVTFKASSIIKRH